MLAKECLNNSIELHSIMFEYLDNNLVQRIKGIVLEHDSVLKKILADLFGFRGNYYVCCNIFFHFAEEYSVDTQTFSEPFSTQTVSKRIADVLEEYWKFYALDLKNNLFVYIINLENEADKVAFKMTILKIEKLIEDIIKGCEITIGIGRIRKGINNLWKSYSDAMTAIEKRSPSPGFQVIDADDIAISYNVSYSFNEEGKVINCMKAKDMPSLKDVLESIIRKNSANNLSHKHMNILFSQLYNTGIRYAAEVRFDIKKVASEDEQQLFSIDNTSIVKFDHKLIRLLVFLSRVMEIVADESKGNTGTLISRAIDYIDNNYSNDIYIEKIALNMGLSVKYLSRMFKLKTGLNLADYISLVRVKKSKELLINSNLNIDEVCRQVGFFSRVTFYRSFKKFEGTSPSYFRKSRDNLYIERT